jgi:hypothetical protein
MHRVLRCRAALGVLVSLKKGTWEQLAPLFDECLDMLIAADPGNSNLVCEQCISIVDLSRMRSWPALSHEQLAPCAII